MKISAQKQRGKHADEFQDDRIRCKTLSKHQYISFNQKKTNLGFSSAQKSLNQDFLAIGNESSDEPGEDNHLYNKFK